MGTWKVTDEYLRAVREKEEAIRRNSVQDMNDYLDQVLKRHTAVRLSGFNMRDEKLDVTRDRVTSGYRLADTDRAIILRALDLYEERLQCKSESINWEGKVIG